MEPVTKPDSSDADLQVLERVLRLEAQGILRLAESLSGRFSQALDLLCGVAGSGRVVVTGIGKSGHIARKMAATLASTGTPALFVHPAEASHGDLGMITPSDVVVAFSNSGETPELSDLVSYTRRLAISLIAITGRADGALAEAADVALVLPPSEEACPMGISATTSTTVMLALGDAIAVALFERKGAVTDDLRVFHPGGQIGRKLLRVVDIMHGGEELPLIGPDTSMSDALLVMTTKRFGCVGIVEGEDRLAGIITDGDLRRHMNPDLLRQTAVEVMTRGPKTIGPKAFAAEALRLMNARAITSLFVVEADRPIGIVHIHDCLRAGVA